MKRDTGYTFKFSVGEITITELLEKLAKHLSETFNDVKRFEPFDISAVKDGMINTQFPFEGLTVTVGVMTKDGKTKVRRNTAVWERVVSVGKTYYTF